MKKMLVLLLALGTFSSFANDAATSGKYKVTCWNNAGVKILDANAKSVTGTNQGGWIEVYTTSDPSTESADYTIYNGSCFKTKI